MKFYLTTGQGDVVLIIAMLKRMIFLTLGVWMMFASSAFATPGHCAVSGTQADVQADATPMSDHCKEMMGEMADADQHEPSDPAAMDSCCCPAVMTALPASLLPPADQTYVHASWASPLPDSAASHLFLLEAPPPRA